MRDDISSKYENILKELLEQQSIKVQILKSNSNLSFKYPNSKSKIIENINITIKENQKIALVGPSGSGKTTLADIILGLLKPTSVKMFLNNKEIKVIPQDFFSYVPQDPFIIEDTIKNNIVLGMDKKNINEDKLANVIKDAALDQFIYNLPEGLSTSVGENGLGLSGWGKTKNCNCKRFV